MTHASFPYSLSLREQIFFGFVQKMEIGDLTHTYYPFSVFEQTDQFMISRSIAVDIIAHVCFPIFTVILTGWITLEFVRSMAISSLIHASFHFEQIVSFVIFRSMVAGGTSLVFVPFYAVIERKVTLGFVPS